ncbi:MAG: HD-GYP domain-containing protein, partial [Bacillota bacterium]
AGQDIHQVLKYAEDRMYRNKMLEMDSVRSSLISSLMNALTEKSQENEDHAERLEIMAVAVGREMGLDDNYLADLTLLARLHDLGKVVLPDEILSKEGPLTDEEWMQIRTHPEAGFRIAQTSPEMAPVARAILSHHERYDGKGYPQGIKGEEIPLIARVIAVADAYDAMTSGRPYRPAITHREAIDEIERCAGTQFDPRIAQIFVRIFADGPPWDQGCGGDRQ